MAADDLLRRYLRQRMELGDTEITLESLGTKDVARLVAAGRTAPAPRAPRVARVPAGDSVRPSPSITAAEPPSAPPIVEETTDWREVLRRAEGAAGPASPAPASPPRFGTKMQFPAPPAAEGTAPPTAITASRGLVIGSPTGDLFEASHGGMASLADIVARVASCTLCPLSATAINPVPGEGNPEARLVCVGEAPGATEDETGRPFVGQAGQLLTRILAAIDLKREDVFICNVLKHRPPNNRNPRPEEVKACSPYLVRQIELIRPKVIIAFGAPAAQTLLDTMTPIGKLRGFIHEYYGIPLIATYHPAALLRNPAWKRPTWEDVQLARRILDSAGA